MKKIGKCVLIIFVFLIAIFLTGRFGWKLLGFRACQNAGIESVEVGEHVVHMTGFYPGSFPEGFCGYYAKEQDGKLYVGFRFSAVFGIFETGDFDITIPVKGKISEVIMKTSMHEYSVWNSNAIADETVTDDTVIHVPAPEEKPTTLEAYATVIGEYYTVLSEGWEAAQVMEQGLNYMVADSFFDNPLEEIGYMVADLDGDGVPQLLFDSTERNRYYYAGGIKFANIGSSDWNESFVTTLKLEDRELIDMTYTTDPADYVQPELKPFARWVR